MQYIIQVTINQPIDKVIELFQDPDSLPHWMDGFVSMDHVSGEPGKAGGVSTMTFNERGRNVVMTETIKENNLPESFIAIYETNGVHNVNKNRFEATGAGQTRWIQDTEFRFSGLMAIMALIMGGVFKRQTRKAMEAFKSFAESQ
jgi:uncharacterized membrane protein